MPRAKSIAEEANSIRDIFDEETRRKSVAFAADAGNASD
jgi:hypothetical protein